MNDVTESALVKRINQRLPEGEMLRAVRGERAQLDLGRYFVHDTRHNLTLEKDVDLEALAREVGAL